MRKATFVFALVAVLAGAGILHQEQQLNPQQQLSRCCYPNIELAAGAAMAAAAAAAAPAARDSSSSSSSSTGGGTAWSM
jgi:hypothetical protein